MDKRWTDEEIEKFREIYPNTDNREVMEILGRTRLSITGQAFRLGIQKNREVIGASIAKRNTSRKVNHNYFHDIDTPDKAYWLGWMWSDGSVYKSTRGNSYEVILRLSVTDKAIVELFRSGLETDAKIFNSTNNSCNIRITSKTMFDDLVSHGVIPNKSTLGQFPIGVPDYLACHFVRGTFDGDGCIGFYGSGKNARLIISGTQQFCMWTKEIVRNSLGISGALYQDKRGRGLTWSFNLSSKQNIIDFAQWMYQDCGELKLNRKYNKFLENGLL